MKIACSRHREGRSRARGPAGGLGHDVVIGTRDVEQTLTRTEPDNLGYPPFAEWQNDNSGVRLVPFPEAGAHGELLVNATGGAGSLAALEATGAENLASKELVDLALALDFSEGMPPLLLVANTDSLGEQIQRTFPGARVVKALNTVFFEVMIEPQGARAAQRLPRVARRRGRRKPSRVCYAPSAGRMRRSSTSASGPRAAPRCTCRSISPSTACSTPSTSTSQSFGRSERGDEASQL